MMSDKQKLLDVIDKVVEQVCHGVYWDPTNYEENPLELIWDMELRPLACRLRVPPPSLPTMAEAVDTDHLPEAQQWASQDVYELVDRDAFIREMIRFRKLVERIGKPTNKKSTNKKSVEDEFTNDTTALAIFTEDMSLTKTQIAERMGLKNVQSLAPARCPKLDAAMKAAKGNRNGFRKGTKGSDGSIEAW